MKLEELTPLQRSLLEAYAKKYRMSLEDLLKELENFSGELTDRLKEFVSARKGYTAHGHLFSTLKYSVDKDSGVYRVPVQVVFSQEEVNNIVSALGLPDDAKSLLVSAPFVSVWVADKKLADRIRNMPVGSRVDLYGFRAKQRQVGDTVLWSFSARSLASKGVDYDFLAKMSYSPSDVPSDLENGESIILRINQQAVLDPVYVSTSSGNPAIRIYVGDIQVDFIGSAATAVEALGGRSADFWQSPDIVVRAVYGGIIGDGIKYFKVFAKPDVVPMKK